jgi:hypothetical protein
MISSRGAYNVCLICDYGGSSKRLPPILVLIKGVNILTFRLDSFALKIA